MGRAYSEAEILNQLAPWVDSMKFNPVTREWTARFLPKRVHISADFKSLVTELEKHVVHEIVQLVAEALEISPEIFYHKCRKTNNADARIVAAIVVTDNFNLLRYRSIGKALGWSTHNGPVHAKKQRKVREIQQLLKKVYKTFPQLETGQIEIINRN